MPESDLTWLSLLVFLPAIFAVGLLAFPPKWTEGMRWWALFGTAGTLALALCVAGCSFRLWALWLGPCSRPVMEMPGWCLLFASVK